MSEYSKKGLSKTNTKPSATPEEKTTAEYFDSLKFYFKIQSNNQTHQVNIQPGSSTSAQPATKTNSSSSWWTPLCFHVSEYK